MAPATVYTYAPLDTEAGGVQQRVHQKGLWRRTRAWFVSIYEKVAAIPNLSELVAVALVYLVQGVTDLATLAQKYMLKDELGASPAEVSYVLSAAGLPWTVKPLIGLLSDMLPLWGYRRKSYLVAAGLAGALSWLALALAAHSLASALGLILLTSAASAVSDVVVDSMVVERARREQQADSGSLQSLCWAAYAVGQVGSAYWSGSLVGSLGPRPVFALTALLPLLVVLVGLGVREQRGPGVLALARRLWEGGAGGTGDPSGGQGVELPGRHSSGRGGGGGGSDLEDPSGGGSGGEGMPLQPLRGGGRRSKSKTAGNAAKAEAFLGQSPDGSDPDVGWAAEDLDPAALDREQRVPLKASAVADDAESMDSDSDGEGSCVAGGGASVAARRATLQRSAGAAGAGAVAARLAGAARAVWSGFACSCGELWATVRRREVAGPVVFLFFSSATPAADDAMFFFMTGPLGFTPAFLGDVQLAVAVASLVGVGVYHAFLRRRPLRAVLLWGSLLCALCQSSSLVLATRVNVALGLDDHWFALGDSVLVTVIQNVLSMPLMVLCARLCPPGMEATLFASLMSISNIAAGLRYMLGAALMQLLGVTATNFGHLPLLIAICSLALLAPLPLLALVPAKLDTEEGVEKEDETEDKDKEGSAGGGAGGDATAGAGGGSGGSGVSGDVEGSSGLGSGNNSCCIHSGGRGSSSDGSNSGGGSGRGAGAGGRAGSAEGRGSGGDEGFGWSAAAGRGGRSGGGAFTEPGWAGAGLPVSCGADATVAAADAEADSATAAAAGGSGAVGLLEGPAGRVQDAGSGGWWSEEGMHHRRHEEAERAGAARHGPPAPEACGPGRAGCAGVHEPHVPGAGRSAG